MGLHGWTVRPSSGCVFCLSQRLATLAQQRVPKLSKERSARWPGQRCCAFAVLLVLFTSRLAFIKACLFLECKQSCDDF
nr:MAG TPA: hypothetical protein [Caudoviricetes sp.]